MLTDEIINKSFLFKSLDARGRETLLSGSEPFPFKKGHVFMREGEEGDFFYLLHSGTVDVTMTKDGQTVTLATLADGAFFGEVAVITGEPRTATVSAATDGDAVRFGRDKVREILKTYPRVALILKKIVAQRTEDTIRKISGEG